MVDAPGHGCPDRLPHRAHGPARGARGPGPRGGRARTWFCRSCIEAAFAAAAIFADRNQHLELLDPQWWTHPASDAQIAYLTGLMDQREVPKQIAKEIEEAVENVTKGQVSRWLSLLDAAPWKRTDADKVVTLGPREIVH